MEGKVDDEEQKRLKRLELNKKAAQESRKRKVDRMREAGGRAAKFRR